MDVKVYTLPNCVQCGATKRALTKKGIDFEVVDLSTDEAAAEFVRELGHMAAPVVTVGEDHWSGFQPAKINALAESLAA